MASFDTMFDQVNMQLNVTNITYGDTILFDDDGMGAILSSTEDNLLYVAGSGEQLYKAWADNMSTIPGVSCTETGEDPHRFGYCETWSSCDEIWTSMKDLTIRIDDVVYTLPPQAQATPNSLNVN